MDVVNDLNEVDDEAWNQQDQTKRDNDKSRKDRHAWEREEAESKQDGKLS